MRHDRTLQRPSTATRRLCAGLHPAVPAPESLTIARLIEGDEGEALGFLSRRPLRNVIMSGLIRDNGLESSFNRGHFYGCRDARGRLVGVALVGHVTLFEAPRLDALLALARSAPATLQLKTIIGEAGSVRLFCEHRADLTPDRLRSKHEQLLALCQPPADAEPVNGLRVATLAHLELVMSANAEMAEGTCGVNPLRADPVGFRVRTARRIEQGRVWVWCEGGRLVFKVDVASETPEAIYLEGLYVDPRERGKGHAQKCLSHLSCLLLRRAPVVCLMVEEGNATAQALYRRLGFKLHCTYERVTLAPSIN
ncbi:MAG: GNAT family N-acetyltransferase [Pyrinomonadaceae bacterium]